MSFPLPRRWLIAVICLEMLAPGLLPAQVKSQAERLREAEQKIAELEARDKKRAKELDEVKAAIGQDGQDGKKPKGEDKIVYSDGVLTLGGVKLRLGGKAEILFVDSQSERDGVVGSTENPDPRFELNRLRLSPSLILNKEMSLSSQIDFKPEQGRTLLKELVARHRVDPEWWFRSDLRLGLDDRFMRPNRRTKNYPLLGNAFWRDESIALTWMLRFGDRNGKPLGGAGAAGEDGVALQDDEGQPVEDPGARARSAARRAPFDFAGNWGEVRAYFSLGNGNSLDSNEVGFDGAPFNDLVQDNRNTTEDLSIREVGLGLGYARSFESFGEIELLGFYYNDELSDASVEFLQQDLTVRNPVTGARTAGYGDSSSTTSYKYGLGGEYVLPAAEFLPASWKPRGGDGLRLGGQFIRAHDGHLIRDGWYAQASYRYSFPKRLIADKYFRSIEPVVRYGILDTNIDATPRLPGTWDRRQLLLGMNIEVIKEVMIRLEYTFNRERTGSGTSSPGPSSVDNDELMAELLITF